MTVWGVDGRDWPYALRDVGLQTLRDKVFGLAAALTYFTVIALFPAIVAFVSLLAFLLWVWMLDIAVLGGVELNLQLDGRRRDATVADADDHHAGEKAA